MRLWSGRMFMPEKHSEKLALEEIPFMHWGIITKYNYDESKARYVPRKRWDPLSSSEIFLVNERTGEIVRLPRRRGHFSYISPIRSARPGASKPPVKKPLDVFEKIISGEDYAIFVTVDERWTDSAFSLTPVKMNIKGSKATTIINRFPAMIRYLDPNIRGKIESKLRNGYTKLAFGINLITFPVDYAETLSDVSFDSLVALLSAMAKSIEYTVKEAMDKGAEIIPVYPFFNIGYMAGGSQPRLHSQTYVDLNMDGHGVFMENVLIAFAEQQKKGYCHLCTAKHRGRIIYENSSWIAWATLSPRRNYHLRLSPKRHIGRITELDEHEIRGLADALIVLSKALDEVGVSKDRNVLIYSNPYGYKSPFHLFVDIIPFERVGGIEILDTVRVVRVAPEDVAERLKKVIKEKEISSL